MTIPEITDCYGDRRDGWVDHALDARNSILLALTVLPIEQPGGRAHERVMLDALLILSDAVSPDRSVPDLGPAEQIAKGFR